MAEKASIKIAIQLLGGSGYTGSEDEQAWREVADRLAVAGVRIAANGVVTFDVAPVIPLNVDDVDGTLAAANGGTGLASYTVGDLLYASGVATLAKLADVATGNVLLSGGVGAAPSYGKVANAHVDASAAIAYSKLAIANGDISWSKLGSSGAAVTNSSQYRARAYHSTTQSHTTSGQFEAVLFDSEDFDVGSLHDTSTNTSRFTIPAGGGGLYLFMATVTFDGNSTGTRVLEVRVDGSAVGTRTARSTAAAAVDEHVSIQSLLSLAAGQYVEVFAFQSSGGALDMGNATRQIANEAAIVKLW